MYRPFQGIKDTSEYITGNGFIRLCDKYNIPFAKTDNVWEGLAEVNARIANGEKIRAFVTHQSDYSITETHVGALPPDVIWFAENCEVVGHPRVIGIPNGLNNMELVKSKASKNGQYSSCFSHLASFHTNLVEAQENITDNQTKNLVYMNFTPDTSMNERSHVYNLFKSKSFVTVETGISHLEFAKSVTRHPFVLSPRGNGYDCVRTWESLYLGSIPIIKKNNVMSHFEDLPILFVDSWEDVNLDLLLDFLSKVKNGLTLKKASMSYWDAILAKYKTEET